MFIKIAILALYKRIFGHVTLANTLILSGVAFVCVFYIAMVSSLAAACIPHSQDYAEGGWSSASYTTRCQRYSIPLSATTGIVGAIIDIYILIVPQFFIWGLQTSRKRKASVSLVFIIGSAYVECPSPSRPPPPRSHLFLFLSPFCILPLYRPPPTDSNQSDTIQSDYILHSWCGLSLPGQKEWG